MTNLLSMTDPTPPVAPEGAASTRDRLVDAAARLFYEQGVHIGVDTLCKAAGVSKRSMYQLFHSKDELVSASLERIAPDYRAALLPADDIRSPRARILHIFERLEYLAPAQEFRGCPYVAAAVQLKSPRHPASVVARRQKDALTSFFRSEAERGGAPDPERLARQLTLVFDGASARTVVRAEPLDGLAVVTATTLLDAAGVVDTAGSGGTDPQSAPV